MEDEAVIRQFYQDLVSSLTEPRWFYTERYPQMSFNYAVAFGLVVSWIAAALKGLIRILNHESFFSGFLKIRDHLMQMPGWRDLPPSIWAQDPESSALFMPGWLAELSTLALYPFSFLINIAISAVALSVGGMLFLGGARTAVTRDKADMTQFMKLAAVASTPALVGAILGFLPLGLGSFIGVIYSFFMLLFAISIRYQVSSLRSFAIVFTPWLALAMAGACIVGIFGAVIVGLVTSLLG